MSFLEKFRAGSELDSIGQFTLDESKARQKMARFQLVSNHEFLMLVVQAAVAAGCTSIAISQGAEGLRLVASGALLDPEAVTSKDDFLFDSSTENVSYQLLAVAANAVEPLCVAPPVVCMQGDDLHFEARLSRPLTDLTSLLATRLRHLPCPLILDGQDLPRDPLGGKARVQFREFPPTSITLVRFGVIVEQQQHAFLIDFVAVVEANTLALDASFSHVVSDAAYNQVLEALKVGANEALAEIARSYTVEGLYRPLLLDRLRKSLPDPAGDALEAVPLFPLADREGYASLKELLVSATALSGKVMTSTRRFNMQMQSLVVLTSSAETKSVLLHFFPPSALLDAEIEFRQREQAEGNRKIWEGNARPTELPPGEYACQTLYESVTWEAVLGFSISEGARSSLTVLYQGRLLASEPLPEAPPGTTVVINFRQGQVDSTWSRMEGREYRAALKELKTEIDRFFDSQIFPVVTWSKLADYLLEKLCRNSPPRVATSSGLFPTTDTGPPLTLEQVAALPRIALGQPCVFSDKIPAATLPQPLLLYSDQRHKALTTQLRGKAPVEDLRKLQKHLRAVEERMAAPVAAAIAKDVDLMVCEPFADLGARGEVALTTKAGTSFSISLLKNGVEFETLTLGSAKVLAAVAVIDHPGLTLDDAWTGFVPDEAYKALLEALKQRVAALEVDLLDNLYTPSDLVLRVLRAYPQPVERYWERKMFTTTEWARLCSLAELEAELTRHGGLLRGISGVVVSDRIALATPAKDIESFLKNALGPFAWQEAARARSLQEKRASFTARKVDETIKVDHSGRFRIAIEHQKSRGEVVLLRPKDFEAGGGVDFYVDGRFVCRKPNFLPKAFQAAVESELFTLSEDCSDVAAPASLQAELLEICAKCMIESLALGDPIHDLEALRFFASQPCSDLAKDRFAENCKLLVQGTTAMSLKSLRESKIKGYVGPGFPRSIPSEGNVLRLPDPWVKVVAQLLGKRLEKMEDTLLEEQRRRKFLQELSTSLDDIPFQRSFASDDLRATLGVTASPRATGLDGKGGVVGALDLPGLPVAALVFGARSSKGDSGGRPRASLTSKQHQQVEVWAGELYLAWVEELSHRSLASDDRDIALKALDVLRLEIGNKGTSARARTASLLWDMPLYRRVDGTLLSGRAIAAQLAETGAPITIAHSGWRAPGSAVLVDEDAPELNVLRALLGKDGLRPFEASPLVDTEELKSSVKSLVAWGLAPMSMVTQKLAEAMRPDRVVKKEKRTKKEVVVRPPDPGVKLILQLEADLRDLLGKDRVNKSDELFLNLQFGTWPLGPPLFRFMGRGSYKLNGAHAGVRWLLAEAGDERTRRVARMLLIVHWVGLANVASEDFRDDHEDKFLTRLVERMTQTFSGQAPSWSPPE